MLARNFRSARSYTIVVLVPDIANPFYSHLIRRIEDRAHQKGYAVLLGDTRRGDAGREREYVRGVETRLAEAIIQLRPYAPEQGNAIPDDVACLSAAGCAARL